MLCICDTWFYKTSKYTPQFKDDGRLQSIPRTSGVIFWDLLQIEDKSGLERKSTL